MKIYYRTCFFLVIATLVRGVAFSQTRTNMDSLSVKFMSLLYSTNEKDKITLKEELYGQLKSKDERNMLLAMSFFDMLKMTPTADSIKHVIEKTYPQGIYIRNVEVKKVYDESNAVKKEHLYNIWVKKFPPQKFVSTKLAYDYACCDVAKAYASDGNTAKAMEYAYKLQSKQWLGIGCYSIAKIFLEKGDTLNATSLILTAITTTEEYMKEINSDRPLDFANLGYPRFCRTYAEIMYKQKKYEEAIAYSEKVPYNIYKLSTAQSFVYSGILSGLGRNLEAFICLDQLMSEGETDSNIKQKVKDLYVKLNGTEQGFNTFMMDKQRRLEDMMIENILKTQVKEPAPLFSVTDADGNNVSLAQMKGKVVILDFWATWCNPCKKSFPAMQMAVNIFKEDPDVKFLFIHTWEKNDNAQDDAVKYLKDHNFPFQLLMDLKNPATGINQIAKDYKIKGIPAKFVIDRDGNIRFRLTGFSGSDSMAVQKLSLMIEIAKKAMERTM